MNDYAAQGWYFNDALGVWQLLDDMGNILAQLEPGQSPPQASLAQIRSFRDAPIPHAVPNVPPPGQLSPELEALLEQSAGAQGQNIGEDYIPQGQELSPLEMLLRGIRAGAESVIRDPLGNPLTNPIRSPLGPLGPVGGELAGRAFDFLRNPDAGRDVRQGEAPQVEGEEPVVDPNLQAQKDAIRGLTPNAPQTPTGSLGTPNAPGTTGALGAGPAGGGSNVIPPIGDGKQSAAMALIEGLSTGPASRTLLKHDPESFIALLLDEAGGPNVDASLSAFITGNAEYLYHIADLMSMADQAYGVPTDLETNVKEAFRSFTQPGEYFVGKIPNVLRLIGEAKYDIEDNATAAAEVVANRVAAGGSGDPAATYFDSVFQLVSSVVSPSLGPLARQLFGPARMVMERSRYFVAKAKGTFTGSPLDWMVYKGIISLANSVPGTAGREARAAEKSAQASAAKLPKMADTNVYEEPTGE